MDENRIDDISELSDLSNLKQLFLGGNKIKDISPVSKLTDLEALTLWGNQISDISHVKQLRGSPDSLNCVLYILTPYPEFSERRWYRIRKWFKMELMAGKLR